MKRVMLTVTFLVLSFLLAACGRPDAAADNTPDRTKEKPTATRVTSEKPALTKEPEASPTSFETEELSSYSYAHSAMVYADPDAYAGKVYGSLFQIAGEKQQYEGKTVYYAIGFHKDQAIRTYTVFDFGEGEIPELEPGEVVYARGKIAGKGFLSDGTNSVDTLWLNVSDIERHVSTADINVKDKEYTFENGEHTARNDSMFIEIISLGFSKDGLMLSTKTFDKTVEKFETYYFDIIVHQDGYYEFYSECNFWIQPGSAGFDNIPLSAMDSAKDMTIEFIPFSEDGSLIYEPMSVDISLGE